MDAQIEKLDPQTEAEIEIALDELRSVQFCDNTYTQSVEAREEVEVIIRELAKRLTKRAPDVGVCTCENVTDAHRGTWLICAACLKPRRR